MEDSACGLRPAIINTTTTSNNTSGGAFFPSTNNDAGGCAFTAGAISIDATPSSSDTSGGAITDITNSNISDATAGAYALASAPRTYPLASEVREGWRLLALQAARFDPSSDHAVAAAHARCLVALGRTESPPQPRRRLRGRWRSPSKLTSACASAAL